MPLINQELATISTGNRVENEFTVTVHSDDQRQQATFNCRGESDARGLRDAVRRYAGSLAHVADYRDHVSKKKPGAEKTVVAHVVSARPKRCVELIGADGQKALFLVNSEWNQMLELGEIGGTGTVVLEPAESTSSGPLSQLFSGLLNMGNEEEPKPYRVLRISPSLFDRFVAPMYRNGTAT
jgi:hypothetical protein